MCNIPNMEEILINRATQNNVPIGGTLEILPLCNMNCDMCYVRLSKEEMEKKGKIRSADEWLSVAAEMKKQGTLFLVLTGGEIFLYPEFEKLYRGLLDLGMIVTINTNGTLIDERIADFLGKYKPRRVNITLYGKDSITYQRLCHYEAGFERTIRGITLLKQQNVDIKINGSLTETNKEEWEELLNIAKTLQLPITIDTYMYPASRERKYGFRKEVRMTAEDAAESKVKILEKSKCKEEFLKYCRDICDLGERKVLDTGDCSMKCRAGKSSFAINWQGKMMPCVMMSMPAIDLFAMGFSKSWELLVKEVQKIKISSECANCAYTEVCQACAATAILETGNSENTPKYLCSYTKTMIKGLNEKIKG